MITAIPRLSNNRTLLHRCYDVLAFSRLYRPVIFVQRLRCRVQGLSNVGREDIYIYIYIYNTIARYCDQQIE